MNWHDIINLLFKQEPLNFSNTIPKEHFKQIILRRSIKTKNGNWKLINEIIIRQDRIQQVAKSPDLALLSPASEVRHTR